MILSITPSSSATTSVSLEVKSTLFQLGALIFHLLLLFIGFSTQEGTRSTHLASSPAHGLLLFFFFAFYRNCFDQDLDFLDYNYFWRSSLLIDVLGCFNKTCDRKRKITSKN